MDEFLAPAFAQVKIDLLQEVMATAGTTNPRQNELVARFTDCMAAVDLAEKKVRFVIAGGIEAEARIHREAQLSKMSPSKREAVGV